MNPELNIDFYKADHKSQYPKRTTMIYSNFTPRSSRLANMGKLFDDKVVVFGIQAWIKDFLIKEWNENFFNKPLEEVLARYKRRMDTSLGEGAVSIKEIEGLHNLGYLPILIKALPEGSRCGIKVPVLTIRNTLPQFFWLTNYLESVMSADLWKPMTTATIAYEYRRILTKYAQETGAPLDFIPVQAHDFSFRGMSGRHDATFSGMGHLTSFVGTDTVSAIDSVEEFYNVDSTKELIGCSVPATEHSVMCMGTKEDEIETFRRLITETYPSGIVSIVSDTWDFWKVMTEFTVELKDEILSRKPNALGLCKTTLRPDSGDPVKVLCGYKFLEENFVNDQGALTAVDEHYCLTEEKIEAVKINKKWYGIKYFYPYCNDMLEFKIGQELTEAEVKGAVECLWDVFGGTTTDKGYRMLNDKVGLIYGDSITLQRADEILRRLKDKGFASSNVVFGVGSYTYQYITRDTFGFAMKATYGEVNGEGREIFKDPITDSGTKKSAKGLLKVEKTTDGDFLLIDQCSWEQESQGLLTEVFKDGKLLVDQKFSDIRNRLW